MIVAIERNGRFCQGFSIEGKEIFRIRFQFLLQNEALYFHVVGDWQRLLVNIGVADAFLVWQGGVDRIDVPFDARKLIGGDVVFQITDHHDFFVVFFVDTKYRKIVDVFHIAEIGFDLIWIDIFPVRADDGVFDPPFDIITARFIAGGNIASRKETIDKRGLSSFSFDDLFTMNCSSFDIKLSFVWIGRVFRRDDFVFDAEVFEYLYREDNRCR